MEPDPTLSFEEGEVIYENSRIREWVRMWRFIGAATLPLWPAFYMFEIYEGNGVPSLQWASSHTMFAQVPLQAQDAGSWDLDQVKYCDDNEEHDYMNMQYAMKRSFVRPFHSFYQVMVLGFLHMLYMDYATKVSYNKDKDIVFVNKAQGIFRDCKSVFEVHHLEQIVPSPVTAFKDLGGQYKDGILTLHCLATHECI